jgi:esterase
MKLFIHRFGQGFPVIILHGLLGLSDNWVSLGRRLAADFDIIIPDIRNHGQSPHSTTFDYPSLVDDLKELVRDLGLKRFSLIGHSLGGKIAMLYALQYPETLEKLVVVDISLRKYTDHKLHEELIDAMLSVDFNGIRSRGGIDEQMKRKIGNERLRQFLLKSAYWRDKEHLAWRIDLESIKNNLPKIYGEISSQDEFLKPVLFIRGGLSDYISRGDPDKILKNFPFAHFETIENATHWVHADAPDEFYDRVWNFLIS